MPDVIDTPEVSADAAAQTMLADLAGASLPSQQTQPKPAETPAAKPAAAPAPAAAPQDPIKGIFARAKETRDLSGLDEEEAEIFQNMAKKGYERLLPIYKEYKSLAPHKDKLSKLPELEKELTDLRSSRWYDHPNAYQLTPEYEKAQNQIAALDNVYNHFAKQLDALESGAKTVQLLRLNPQTKQLESYEAPVDASTRRVLTEELTAARSTQQSVQSQIEALKGSHSQRYSTHRSNLENLRKTLTGEYQDVIKDRAAKELAKLPGYFQADPMGPIAADLIALVQMAGEAIAKMQAEMPGKQANAKAAQQAPPTRDGVTPSAPMPKSAYSAEEFKLLQSQGMV